MGVVPGLKIFQSDVYPGKRRLFKKLARGQSPDTLYITCSDSRIDLSLMMQTEPGELFIVHNAGNIIPPLGSGPSGELASIEFVVAALGIKLAVVCGHSDCGAMKALLDPETLGALPWVAEWLEYAEPSHHAVSDKRMSSGTRLKKRIEANVLLQMQNLRTHLFIAEREARGELESRGWVYEIGSGEVRAYSAETERIETVE